MTDSPLTDAAPEPRTYSGWKMTLGIIAAIAAVALLINVVGDRTAPRNLDRPPPVITSVTPAP